MIRLVIIIPMFVAIFYAVSILSQPHLITTLVQVYVLFAAIIISAIVIIITSQVTVPWANDEQQAQYIIDELMKRERVYLAPTVCTKCLTTIELNKVRWDDEYTFHCPECQAEIKLRIIEKQSEI